MKKSITLSLFVMAAVSTGVGGPIQRADIPADPAWVAHLDFDALRPTTIGKFVLAELSKPEADNKLSAFQAMFSFDPRRDLHAVSLYSVGSKPEEAVLIAYADFDAERLANLAKGAQDYQSTSYRSHTIHNWIDEKKPAKDGVKPRTYAAIFGKRVIFGQREAHIGKALDVMERVTGSLATSPAVFANMGTPKGGAFLQGASRKLDIASSDPNTALFRLTQNVALEAAETQGQIAASLVMEAADEEVAGHMNSVAQGLLSLMKLQQEKPGQVKLAEAATLKQEGTRVIGTFNMAAQTFIDLAKAEAARKAAAKGAK